MDNLHVVHVRVVHDAGGGGHAGSVHGTSLLLDVHASASLGSLKHKAHETVEHGGADEHDAQGDDTPADPVHQHHALEFVVLLGQDVRNGPDAEAARLVRSHGESDAEGVESPLVHVVVGRDPEPEVRV